MVISPALGMYIILRYSEKIIFPDTQAKIPKVKTIMAELPAAKPSIPSVKLAPFEKAVTIKTTKGMNTNHEYGSELGIQSIKSA